MTPPPEPRSGPRQPIREFFGVFQYSGRALQLVWTTSRALTLALVVLSIASGILPAGIAYVGKWLVDAVVSAAAHQAEVDRELAFFYVSIEATLVVLAAGCMRGVGICQSLLRAQLGNRVNVLILEKALTLELTHFEDSELYDKLTQARREASSRPLSLVMRTFGLAQNMLSLVTYGALLLQFSALAVGLLAVAAVPAFIAEAKYSGEAFRLFRWRTPETRQQMYLEAVIAREDYAKEVKLFDLCAILLKRYNAIFHRLYAKDRSLTLRRGVWGYFLGLLATGAFYGAYAWIVYAAVNGQISLGEMTMYVLVFKQGQQALAAALGAVGGMYEDNLYLSNLYEFLEEDVISTSGTITSGPTPRDGIRFEDVSFVYPGSETPAVKGVSFHLQPGHKLAVVGENGSGKTTLVKLLTRLYSPSSGRILLDGKDLQEGDVAALRRRTAVIFQDFVRYQFTVGENIGAGDADEMQNAQNWETAAKKGMADSFIDQLPSQYQTQLGRWFRNGRELSLGEWQKIALSRAFMKEDADILVLDEPTASMDAAAEARIFDHFRDVTKSQMAILISHRFSTVRMAEQIVVLNDGRILEEGSHEQLMDHDGHYAKLFNIQAAGYK